MLYSAKPVMLYPIKLLLQSHLLESEPIKVTFSPENWSVHNVSNFGYLLAANGYRVSFPKHNLSVLSSLGNCAAETHYNLFAMNRLLI